LDVFNIPTVAFAAGVPAIPTTFLPATGYETTVDARRNRIIVHVAGRLYEIPPAGATYEVNPLAHLFLPDGVQHLGRGVTFRRVGNRIFFFVRKHTSTEFQRIAIVE
jgi:hypothetical protein